MESHAEASPGLEARVACQKKAERAVGGSPAMRSLKEKRSTAQGSTKGGPAARREPSDPGESRRQAGHTDRGRDYWHSDTATASLKGSWQRNKLY